MRHPPPEEVASWPQPNFVNPEFQGPRLPAVGIMLVTISYIVVALRLWVRLRLKHTAGSDDWILVISLPAILAFTILSILSMRFGFGLHIWDNKPEWSKTSRVILYLLQILVVAVATLVKLSLLISYLRFFATRLLHYATWIMIAVNLASGIEASTFASIFACVPPENYWVNLLGDSTGCQRETVRMMTVSSINIATEAIVLVLPLPTLWKLHLPRKERVVLIVLMSLGFITPPLTGLLDSACVASIIRTREMYRVLEHTYDITWTGYNVYLYVIVELNLGIICASIPTLRPLVRKYFPHFRCWRSSQRYPTGSSVRGHSFAMICRADFEEARTSSKATLQQDGTEFGRVKRNMLSTPEEPKRQTG